MLRVRPGVELVRASFLPTSELITLDLPTFERPRNAISGNNGAGKWRASIAEVKNRVSTRIFTSLQVPVPPFQVRMDIRQVPIGSNEALSTERKLWPTEIPLFQTEWPLTLDVLLFYRLAPVP